MLGSTHPSIARLLCHYVQDMLQQKMQMEQDAAVHRQQLQTEKHQHALQLSQEALTAAQAEVQRLQQKHAQDTALSEVGVTATLRALTHACHCTCLQRRVCLVAHLHACLPCCVHPLCLPYNIR